jgi:hypothetical protein
LRNGVETEVNIISNQSVMSDTQCSLSQPL